MPEPTTEQTRRRLQKSRLVVLLAVVGPGIIAANADNDASGIYGYSLAGAQYRYAMLWVLVLSTIALGVCQEICARMGAVTGKGLADLIREEYGVKVTLFAMIALLIANFATTVSEFAGILAAVQLFGGPNIRFVVLPIVALVVWLLVVRGSYKRLERFLLGASFIYLLYIVSAFMAHPRWPDVLHDTFLPDLRAISPLKAYIFMIINVVGTTITPWGQFYIQSSVRDKGIKAEDYSVTRLDVLFRRVLHQLHRLLYHRVLRGHPVCCRHSSGGRRGTGGSRAYAAGRASARQFSSPSACSTPPALGPSPFRSPPRTPLRRRSAGSRAWDAAPAKPRCSSAHTRS